MSHDLTPKERENAKSLHQEAKRREQQDTLGGFKYKVRGPSWDMKIARIKISHLTQVPQKSNVNRRESVLFKCTNVNNYTAVSCCCTNPDVLANKTDELNAYIRESV